MGWRSSSPNSGVLPCPAGTSLLTVFLCSPVRPADAAHALAVKPYRHAGTATQDLTADRLHFWRGLDTRHMPLVLSRKDLLTAELTRNTGAHR